MSLFLFKKLWLVLLFCFLLLSCSSKFTNYRFDPNVAPTTYPKNIYIEDQVFPLNTRGNLSLQDQGYVEIRLKGGEFYSGKLINIEYKDIILSEGSSYNSTTDGDKTIPFSERTISIPKEEILILKMW
jgi:hypothetical protein